MGSTFYCYLHATRNTEKRGTDSTFVAKDAKTKKVHYVLHCFRPEEGQMATATLYRYSLFGPVCITTSLTPIKVTDPTEDGWIGRRLTHRVSEGPTIDEKPDGGAWAPRRFSYRNKQYLWVGHKLFESDLSKKSAKRAKDQATGSALVRTNLPFWTGFFCSRYNEIRIEAGLDQTLIDLVMASSLISMMVCVHGP